MHSKPAKTTNQDAGDVYQGDHCSAVAIADGLGSSFEAHVAARLAVKKFLTGVRALDRQAQAITVESLRQIWQEVATTLTGCYHRNIARYESYSQVLQTTLLTVVDLPESYIMSYLGNGSILHVRGDFWSFWERRWPWCITDLMLGHAFLHETGREVLYGVLTPQGSITQVRFVQVWKDLDYGDMVMLCSDGVSSPDHLRLGRDGNEKLWVEVNPHLEAFLTTYFKQYLTQIEHQSDTAALLTGTLETFLRQRQFDDDATVGLIVSPRLKAYYLAKQAEQGS